MRKILLGIVLTGLVWQLACTSDPQDLLETGNDYFEDGQYREAALIYRRAVQVDARFGEAYYRLGLAEFALGRYLQAFRALIRALEFQPANADAFEKLTDIYLAGYDLDAQNAKQLLSELKEITYTAEQNDIDEFLTLRVRGFIAMLEEREDDAVELFRAALEVRPGDSRVTIALAEAYARLAMFGDAESLLVDALEQNPDFGLGYEALYALYVRQGRVEDAEAVLIRASERNPGSSQSWLQLGAHYHIGQQPEQRDQAISRLTSDREAFRNGHQEAADFYMRVGEYEMAAKLYEEGLSLHPENEATYRLGIAQAFALTGDFTEALHQVDEVLQEDPENDSARVLKSSLRLTSGDREVADQVIQELESLLPRMTQNPVVNYNLGRAYESTGQFDAALVQYQEAIRKRYDYVLPRLALGSLRLQRSEFAMALNEAEGILAMAPGNIPARLLRANALIQLGQFDRAREDVAVLEQIGPVQRQAQLLRASIHAAEGEYSNAETLLTGLREEVPSDRGATAGLLDLYLREGSFEKAADLVDEQIAASPDSPELHILQGRISMGAGKYDRAIREYQTVIEERPDDVVALQELGTAEYHTGDFDTAETLFRQARELAPKDASPSLHLAMLLGEMGEQQETRELLEEVVTLAPDNVIALNNLAYVLADSPETIDRALTLAQRAMKLAPTSPNILDTLGWVYLKKGQSGEAVSVYENLVEIAPKHPTWRYHLGMALYQRGSRREARSQLEISLSSGPSAEEEAEIRALLARIG